MLNFYILAEQFTLSGNKDIRFIKFSPASSVIAPDFSVKQNSIGSSIGVTFGESESVMFLHS